MSFAFKRTTEIPWIKETVVSIRTAFVTNFPTLNHVTVKQGMSPKIAMLGAHCSFWKDHHGPRRRHHHLHCISHTQAPITPNFPSDSSREISISGDYVEK